MDEISIKGTNKVLNYLSRLFFWLDCTGIAQTRVITSYSRRHFDRK